MKPSIYATVNHQFYRIEIEPGKGIPMIQIYDGRHAKRITDYRVIWSECHKYRYLLQRFVGPSLAPDQRKIANFIMLNPSTADEVSNDPTVERCERRCRQMGYDTLFVTNIFAWRSTDPSVLPTLADPVGMFNDQIILETARSSHLVICAWGQHGRIGGRGAKVEAMLRGAGVELHYLKMSRAGFPWHPLYVGYAVQPKKWDGGK